MSYKPTIVSGILTTEDGSTIHFDRALLYREGDVEEDYSGGDAFFIPRRMQWRFHLALLPGPDGFQWHELAPGVTRNPDGTFTEVHKPA